MAIKEKALKRTTLKNEGHPEKPDGKCLKKNERQREKKNGQVKLRRKFLAKLQKKALKEKAYG